MNVYIVVDENQSIEIVCSSKFAANVYIEENIRANEGVSNLNYIEAEVWTLADVDEKYSKEIA